MSVLTAARPGVAFDTEEYEELPDAEPALPRGFEFVDGQLEELNVSFLSTFLAGRCYKHLANFVEPRRLGWVTPEGTSYRCFPDDPTRVRRADTAFHRLEKVTTEQALTEGYMSVVPDLVVEVVSPHDIADAVNRKLLEWMRAGVSLVWIVHPLDRTIHAYGSPGGIRLFTEADTLTAEPVLPEFSVPMGELFRLPGSD